MASSDGSGSFLPLDELARACTAPGVPGLVPHPAQSLALLPGWVLRQLHASRRGVIVLGVDGLSWSLAAACWHAAELTCLTSTFPTTSATAWLTALTGTGPAEHLAVANSYLVPTLGTVVNAVTAQPITWPGQAPLPLEASPDAQLVAPHPTLFERASEQGVTCVAVTRELDGLPGPWTDALLRGADRWDRGNTSASALQAQAADPPASPPRSSAASSRSWPNTPATRSCGLTSTSTTTPTSTATTAPPSTPCRRWRRPRPGGRPRAGP